MGIVDEDDEFIALCIDLAILAEDNTAKEQTRAIMRVLFECSTLLQRWRDKQAEMFPNQPELLETIPDPTTVDVIRLLGVMIKHATCNTARKQGNQLEEAILNYAQSQGKTGDELVILQGDCHNHTRNIWMDHIDNFMGSKLEEILHDDLAIMRKGLRVSCRLGDINLQAEKEYTETANYAKGHGSDFNDWLKRTHPSKRRLPMIRVSGGNCQDASFEAALPIYDALDEFLEFTGKCLVTSENHLQRCLFLTLSCMEVIAMLRAASIIFLVVIVPMRWLAGKTHELGHRNWGKRSMGKAYDCLHEAFLNIKSKPELYLDYDFMMNIFKPLYKQLPELKEFTALP
jgi:hypothetical protein